MKSRVGEGRGEGSVSVFVPATIGNVGPGFDVLGLAVEGLGDTLVVSRAEKASVTITGRDAELVPTDPEKNCAVIAARALLHIADVQGDVSISIHKNLPLSGGLGGSAASSVGGALGAAKAFGIKASDEMILRAALEGEAAVAGRHLDNIAPCYFGGLTLSLSTDPPRVVQLRVKHRLWLALATPALKLETKTARSVLPRELPNAAWTQQMAQTAALVHALSEGDDALVKEALIDRFAEPARAPLIKGFAEAKQAALAAGALAASISGAGPTTFALCGNEKIARAAGQAMQKAFGVATLHVGRVSARGARLLY